MKWGRANIFGGAACLALASGCTPAPQAPAPTDQPSFVSLNPCLDAILVEVAEPEQILAISHYSHQPGGSRMDRDTALSFPSNAGTAEEVIALAPDIVLASVFLAPATQSALERAGLKIETFGSPRTLEESAAQIERVTALAGNPQHAKKLGERLQEPRSYLPSPADIGVDPGPDPSVLLWQAGQIVAGQETLIAQLLKEAGFKSKSEAMDLGQADYVTLERILSDPPDLLLIAGDSAGQRHPALQSLTNTRVHVFDPRLFYCGGPSVAEAREELYQLRRSFDRTKP